MIARVQLVALALALALAAALRLHQIGLAPFWMDELATLWFARLPLADLLGPMLRLEANPPGYYLLLRAIAPLTGEGEAGLRLPAAIAGTLAVLTTHAYAKRAFGPGAALLAACGIAIAAMHVKGSQEARTYALLFLLCSLALALLERAIAQAASSRARLVLEQGVVGAAMIHLHSTAVFAVAALHVYGLVRIALLPAHRGALLRALIGAGLLTLALSGWWLLIAIDIARSPVNSIRWIAKPGLADAAATFAAAFVAPFIDARAGWALAWLGALLGAALLLAIRRGHAPAIALLAALGAGGAMFFAVSQAVPVLLDRTALVLLVFAMPLFAWVAATLRPRILGAAAGLGFVALSAQGVLDHYRTDATLGRQHTPWRHAVERIETRIAPDERAVMLGGFEAIAFPTYSGARLRATRPYFALPHADDHLGGVVVRRTDGVVALDRPGTCPAPPVRGLWTVGFQPAEHSFIAPLMARCGWVLVADEPLSALRIAHWRAPR